ncbi:hypothetical protein [Corynebacterium amycolatum]|uniref:hypothetical protein n=1 Tax=Corynebacterium amycolatum TaxID=43765 RepID=UPI002B245758|nr:hypothetical protein [Corynebacterium amycolatum]MEB2597953.1 hypothetical protein [Corynebacterium amycolatum]
MISSSSVSGFRSVAASACSIEAAAAGSLFALFVIGHKLRWFGNAQMGHDGGILPANGRHVSGRIME